MCCRRRSGIYKPTDAEHVANVLTHAVMIPIGVVASIVLMMKSETTSMFLMAFVYGVGIIALFSVSTAFHVAFYLNNTAELILNKCDRAVIYLFIAVCYAPWLFLIELPGEALFVHLRWLIWVLALTGVLFELTISVKHRILAVVFYVLYGVVPALILDSQMSLPGVYELKLAGACYLIGVIFFCFEGFLPFAHAIWHVFVILGASVHYVSVYSYFYSVSINETIILPEVMN